ncbi:MAG: DUF2231 domain-containing protein [Ilumatobacteraceae bacterium]
MDSIFGVSAHPFFVHIPVVLIPLAAVGVIVMTIRTSWWERYKWATLTVAGVGAVGAIIAAGTGEELEEAVEDTAPRQLLRAHVEAGEVSRTVSIMFLAVLLVGVVVLPWLMRRRNASAAVGAPHVVTSPRWLRSVVSLVLVVVALGASWAVYDAGHTGARSVWSDVDIGANEDGHNRGGDYDD